MSPYPSPIALWMLAAVVAAGTCAAPAQETNRVKTGDFSAFQIISDRNIFNPNRRPRIVNQRQPPKVVDSFSLAGTMSYAKGDFAVFNGSSSDYRRVLQTGGRIASYTVTRIGQDAVTLTADTNRVELQVGMQLRRNADGVWSVAEQADAPETAYASNSSGRDSDRSHWRPGSSGRNNTRQDTQPAVASTAGAANTGAVDPALAGAAAAPADGEPSDPVARMIWRRQQETGGSDNPGPGETSDNPNVTNPDENPPTNENSNPNNEN
jgi:hypothetical protein